MLNTADSCPEVAEEDTVNIKKQKSDDPHNLLDFMFMKDEEEGIENVS